MNEELVLKIQEFSAVFDTARRIWDTREGLSIDYQRLDSKPFDAIMFFTMYAHERPFSNPRYPVAHRIAILKNIGASDANQNNVNDVFSIKCREPGFPSAVWNDFKELLTIDERDKEKTRRTIEKYTKGSVSTILEKLNEQSSIVALLTSMRLREAYEFLKKIDGISHKIAALFLRDISSYYGGWDNADEKDLYCLQPVDRWVKELAKMCWDDVIDKEPEKMAKDILTRFQNKRKDSIDFNKGAWFVGAHFQKLCNFSNIETTMRLSLKGGLTEGTILKFDANDVNKAIGTLGMAESNREIYPL